MIKNLLTIGNPKTLKGEGAGYLTSILHLAPAKLSGYNMCPMASVGCAAACLNTAGRGGMFRKGETTNMIQIARIRKTVWFMEHRELFMAQLVREISAAIKSAEKHSLIPVFRLNGTSDVRWENIPVVRAGVKYGNIMLAFPSVQFYDYTKIANRKNLPDNYSLTFSRSESNDSDVDKVLGTMNIAVVFSTKKGKALPSTYLGRPVIDGDKDDLRFRDPNNVIVGLRSKGKAKKDTSNFTVNV